jgi:hypothetical protein
VRPVSAQPHKAHKGNKHAENCIVFLILWGLVRVVRRCVLDARLNNPWTIRRGLTVAHIFDRLAQAGLEVELHPKGGTNE